MKLAIIFILLVIFQILVAPAWLASDPDTFPEFLYGITVIMFFAFWASSLIHVTMAASKLYNFQFKLPEPWHLTDDITISDVVFFVVFSYFIHIYSFAVLYTFLSNMDLTAFSVGRLDFFTSFYFSLVIASTVGFGDIVPTSMLAKFFVMVEILISLAYLVFIFSVLGTAIRQNKT